MIIFLFICQGPEVGRCSLVFKGLQHQVKLHFAIDFQWYSNGAPDDLGLHPWAPITIGALLICRICKSIEDRRQILRHAS